MRDGTDAPNVNSEMERRHSAGFKAAAFSLAASRTAKTIASFRFRSNYKRKETSMILALASVMIVMCSFSGLVVCGLAKAAGKRAY